MKKVSSKARKRQEDRLENNTINRKSTLRNQQQSGNYNYSLPLYNNTSKPSNRKYSKEPISSTGKMLIGKYRNMYVLTMKDLGYLTWMLENVKMNSDNRGIVQFQIERLQ